MLQRRTRVKGPKHTDLIWLVDTDSTLTSYPATQSLISLPREGVRSYPKLIKQTPYSSSAQAASGPNVTLDWLQRPSVGTETSSQFH